MTTARQIITRAFNEMMYYAEGEAPSAAAMADGLDLLNSMIASWHTVGMTIYYPPGTVWKDTWRTEKTYAVNDAVTLSGNVYVCILAHTSTPDDQPYQSVNGPTYWTLYAETPMTLDSTFFFPAHHERGIIALLAIELCPAFNMQPSALTVRKAMAGEQALYGQYFIVPLASADPGITRMPSQIWPYTIPNVSN